MEDDGDDKNDSKRRSRNLSEKKRRDQFNTLVNELSTMVSTTNRKMDKSTVLKATISFLKHHNDITVKSRAHDVHESWKPSFLSNEEFTYLVLEALEGFIMVFSETGFIYYVSESITSLLGHNPVDIINSSLFDLAYEEDRPKLYNLFQASTSAAESMVNPGTSSEIQFQCHLRRGILDFREVTLYEHIQFNGHFRINLDMLDNDDKDYQHDNESRVLFVCTGRISALQLIRDVSLIDSTKNEFTSRHSLEWKFLFLDHRAPPIIGYLPFEVLGTSGYDYYHFDDLEKIVNCHEALMQKGELTSCYYRFLTKGQQWIWLQTRFYITYHQWSSKPEFVVCTHKVVSYEDIAKSLKEEERADTEPAASEDDTNSEMKETVTDEANGGSISPSFLSVASDAFGSVFQNMSGPASVKSASAKSVSACSTSGTVATTHATWLRGSLQPYAPGSDTTSLSGESRFSQRSNSRETQGKVEPTLVPLHGIGAQYLEPVPYTVGPVRAVGVMGPVGAVRLPAPVLLPLSVSPLPILVSTDHAQMQLQKKHEELQEMIARQQEELRKVKEQLLLARLGMLQPIINIQSPYETSEDQMHQSQQLPAQIVYETSPRATESGYTHQHSPQPSGSQQNNVPQ